MADKNKTQIIRAGNRTYFLDVRQTKDGRNYLVITESRFKGDGKERERQSIRVFPEQSAEFLEELTTAIWSLK
ncbi:MAG: PUR family DNA/RNA-binding protein [Chloroflexi bacterium]|nr:PUR family DNA/RNA-binding protein [Chloroflexota bacterium]